MRHITVQPGMANDLILCVVERHPRGILHHQRLRLPEVPQPFLGITAVARQGETRLTSALL